MACGTMGMRTGPTEKPRSASRRKACTPLAASRPNAEPPESTIGIRDSNRTSEVYGIEFTRPRSASKYCGRGHSGALREHHSHARSKLLVVGVANADPRHVGNQIARSGAAHDVAG